MHAGSNTELVVMRAGHHRRLHALRTVALMEFAKGLAALAAAISLYWVDPSDVVDAFLEFLHISPDHHFAQMLLRSADFLGNASMWWVILVACIYSGLRFAEAVGLWRARPWAEWIGLVRGEMYIPLEAVNLAHRVNLLHAGIPLIDYANLSDVLYLTTYPPSLPTFFAR